MTTMERLTETKKPLTLIVSVKDLQFRTNGLGKMFPVILFNETKELNNMGIDAMLYDSVKRMEHQNIGKGARLKIDFDVENLAPTIKQVIKPCTTPTEIPVSCPSCHHLYFEHDGENFCSNYICSARDRGFLYKMFRMVSPGHTTDLISEFLNKFPTGTSCESLDSFAEFHYVTREMKSFNTQPRLSAWMKYHPENGKTLFDLENKMQEFFSRDEIPKRWFWHICNFPLISEQQFYELVKFNPQQFINGENRDEYLALSKEVRTYLDHNMDMVVWLLKFFNSYKEKSWIDLESHLALSTIASKED